MEPPPGSVPHPIGQGLAVAVRPRRARARLLAVLSVVMGLVYLASGAVLVGLTRGVALPALLLLVLGVVVTVQMAVLIGQAVVMRGPALVVDDAGIRVRDLLGWLQVPWATLQQLSVTRGGGVLVLEAPGGIYLNDNRLRRPLQRYTITGLETEPHHLLTYLQHRRSVARQAVSR
ncbi:PH domain-containing protein [Auraticoccus monumenti]|uniref:PH domain-containing protein n=1 Tax=Auraticoccus monumenti TaxID=675864 RepID=A0A1G6WVM8_9ACTN|nr:PH domain-containing protein [Auraticoccus monumenti]SDD70000.1 PH domain-containing protein [Auraticoccus monumenti]